MSKVGCVNTGDCPSGQWCGLQVGDLQTLRNSPDHNGNCLSTPPYTPGFHPPCNSDGTCPSSDQRARGGSQVPGTCLPPMAEGLPPLCHYNLELPGGRIPGSLASLNPFQLIPSSACADALLSYSNPAPWVCWGAMETALLPVTEAIVEDAGFFGFAVEQLFLYGVWNGSGYGAKCDALVDGWLPQPDAKQRVERYNSALDMCESVGFGKSERKPVDPPPYPPPPPNPSQNAACWESCLTPGNKLGQCHQASAAAASSCDKCMEMPPPAPCDGKTTDQPCVEGAIAGTCHDGPGPSGSAGVCMALPAPLCSSLADIAAPPQHCDDKPLYFEPPSGRRACALLKQQSYGQKDWQCELNYPAGCPKGTVECMWDGNWTPPTR